MSPRGATSMNSNPVQLSWGQSIILVALELLLALIIWFTIWGLLGLAFLTGIKDTYVEWSWYKFSIYLFFWAAWSVWLDIREMRKNPVDSRGK